MTQAQLSRLMKIPQGTISKWESGTLHLSQENIEQISRALRYPKEFFGQNEKVFGFGSSVFYHRKRQSLADLQHCGSCTP